MYFWKTAAANNSWACTKAEHPEEFYKGGRGNWGRVALLWSKARHLIGEPAPFCTVLQLHQWGQKECPEYTGQKRIYMQEPWGSLKPRQGHSNCNLQVLLAIVSYFSILKPRSCMAQPSENQQAECPINPGKVMVVAIHPTEIINHTCGWQRLLTRKFLKLEKEKWCVQPRKGEGGKAELHSSVKGSVVELCTIAYW